MPQVVFLDFDGEFACYNNSDLGICLDQVVVENSGLQAAQIDEILKALQNQFSGEELVFTAQRPSEGEYSTVYIGKTKAFDAYGEFYGLAETVDSGNQNRQDQAFVLLDYSDDPELIVSVTAHEVEHLLGKQHEIPTGTIWDYAYTEQEGSGNWNDTMAQAHFLGNIGSSTLTVNGTLQVRWNTADVDWYYFYPQTSNLSWSVNPVGLVNTCNVTLWNSSGTLLSVLSNNQYSLRKGVSTVNPNQKYYIRCDSSVSGLGSYKFSLSCSGNNSGGGGGTSTSGYADLCVYKPTGWSSSVIFHTEGSQKNKKLNSQVNILLDIAVQNSGKGSAGTSTLKIYIDDQYNSSISVSALNSKYYLTRKNINLGTLSSGKHKVLIYLDAQNNVSEKNKKNNIIKKTITIKDCTIPSQVKNLSVWRSGKKMLASWSAATDDVKVSKYIVHYCDSTTNKKYTLTTSKTSCTLSGVKKEGNWSCYVTAVDSSKNCGLGSSTVYFSYNGLTATKTQASSAKNGSGETHDNTGISEIQYKAIIGDAENNVFTGCRENNVFFGNGGDDLFLIGENWGNDKILQDEGGKVTVWFESGSIENWDPETMKYTEPGNTLLICGVSEDEITLKFGKDDSIEYDNLAGIGAFSENFENNIINRETLNLLANP